MIKQWLTTKLHPVQSRKNADLLYVTASEAWNHAKYKLIFLNYIELCTKSCVNYFVFGFVKFSFTALEEALAHMWSFKMCASDECSHVLTSCYRTFPVLGWACNFPSAQQACRFFFRVIYVGVPLKGSQLTTTADTLTPTRYCVLSLILFVSWNVFYKT